ncbi:hypothetical protein BG004_004677 [Podila humilis]|nr:hypothetical protein BG004_004677 [Podila humilis]
MHSSTGASRPSASTSPHAQAASSKSMSFSILPTPYRPHCPPKEYGIPFHGKRSYHRAQFIRVLDLSSVAGSLSLHHFEILARSSRIGLRTLDLQLIQLPFSEHLLSILVASKQLRSLTLGAVEFPPVEDLAYLKPCLNGLTELRLMNCPDTVGDAVLAFLVRHCPQLRTLEIHGETFTDRSLEFIATTCGELETLVLETPLLSDEVIVQITTGCPKLTVWRLIDCTTLSETTVELLETMYDWDKTPTALSHYDAAGTAGAGETGVFSSSGLLASSPSSLLTRIHPMAINSILRSQTRLEHLTLGGPKITDDSLVCLTEAAYPCLQTLELMDCSEVSDETMVAILFNCDHLTKVGIRGSNFTFRTFSAIALHLDQLEELHLEHVRLIINETVQDIMLRCNHLRVLKLWHCRNLTQDLFTDQMEPCSSLEVLEYMDKYIRLFQNQAGRGDAGGVVVGGGGTAVGANLAGGPGGRQPGYAGTGNSNGVGWEPQVRFLQTLVIRFENLRELRLGKIAETYVPVNLVSYLCQLDRLERFSIFQNPCLDLIDLKELQARLPTLVEVGVGQSDRFTEEEILRFNQHNCRPNVLAYRQLLESSDELASYVYKPNLQS